MALTRVGLTPAALTRLRTFRGVVEYDGTEFSGWQVQPGRRTVQAVLEAALSRVIGAPVGVLAAGRTDAGVHAEGQAVSFRARTTIPPRGIAAACNAALPPDVAIRSLDPAPAAFHATRDAVSKVYRYEVRNSREPSPLARRTSHRVPGPLGVPRMRRAARALVGTHDFRAFRSNPGPLAEGQDAVRTIRRLELRRRGDRVTFEVEGDGFLHHMVRNIVGTLLLVGRGTWDPGRVAEALAARDRRAAGPTAPAHGLTLVSVAYGAPRRRRKIAPGARGRPTMAKGAGARPGARRGAEADA